MLEILARLVIASYICCLIPACVMAQVIPGKPMPPVVSIKVDTTGDMGQVSPQIFGTFIEPIDWSINNGITYAPVDYSGVVLGFSFNWRLL